MKVRGFSMGSRWRKKTLKNLRHGGKEYAFGCAPLFHPEFPRYCEERCQQLAQYKDDPWLLGYFTDNEIRYPDLRAYLALPPEDAAFGSTRLAAEKWLAKRQNAPEADHSKVTRDDQEEWAVFFYETYFSITSKALRRHDPNHLNLGCRFFSRERDSKRILAVAGKYTDVLTLNVYGVPVLTKGYLDLRSSWSGTPILIGEFFAVAEDSGLVNSGVAFQVRNQTDRARFYQNYVLNLLDSSSCIGWHWHAYMDYPALAPVRLAPGSPKNLGQNRGLVSSQFEPYQTFLDQITPMNQVLGALSSP